MVAPSESAILACVQFFETLTKDSVEDIRTLASPRMRYRDPLTDAQGIDAVVAYLHKWFRDLDDIGFQRGDRAHCGNVLLSHWTMQFRVRKMPRRRWTIEGMSRTTFDDDGKVVDHIDYWDTAPMFEAFPVLGRAVTLIRKLAS